LLASGVGAEVPDHTPEERLRVCTHLVGGEVRAVYASVAREGDYEQTKGVVEIRVTAVPKGDGLARGGLVYARYWQSRWVGAGAAPPGSGGHRGLPKAGDAVRVFLKRADDGGYDVLFPDGFQPPEPGPAKRDGGPPRRPD
jgi:hypothetical protein